MTGELARSCERQNNWVMMCVHDVNLESGLGRIGCSGAALGAGDDETAGDLFVSLRKKFEIGAGAHLWAAGALWWR